MQGSLRSLLVVLVSAVALSACARGNYSGQQSQYNTTSLPSQQQLELGALSYRATEALINRGKAHLDTTNPILVTSLANIDDLRQSSTFGRLVGDQASSRLVQLGLVVRDVRLSNTLVVREGTGELILSRDVQKISQDSKAQAILAGTYAIGGVNVYVNMRLISATSGQIISAVDFVVPLDGDTRGLISVAQSR
jgi:TolB-like protein